MANIAALTVAMKLESAKFVSGLKKAQKRTESFTKKTRKGLNAAGKAFGGMSAVGVAALGAIYKSQSANIDQLAKFSDQLGISTAALAGLRHHAELTGVSSSVLDKSLIKLQASVGQAAEGFGVGVKAFDRLGLSATELKKLSVDSQFKAVAEALKGVENQTERATIAYELFGAKGTGLLNTLNGGADAINKSVLEAEKLGVTLTRLDAAKVEQANDAMFRAEQATKGFANQITTRLAPYVETAANQFYNAALESGGFAEVASSGISAVTKAVGWLTKVLDGLNMVWNGLKVIANTAIAGILDGLGWLTEAIEDLTGADLGSKVMQGIAESMKMQKDTLKKAYEESLTMPMTEAFDKFQAEVERKSVEAAAVTAGKVADAQKSNNPYANKEGVELDKGESNQDNKGKVEKERSLQKQLMDIKIGAGKKVQAAQAALNIKTVVSDGWVALQKAWASAPFPLNLPAVAITGAQTAANLAGVKGARANGGPVGSNQSYLVGERGPELFTPSTSGNITNNTALRQPQEAEGNTSLNFNISATDASGVEDLLINNRGLIHNLVRESLAEEGRDF